MFQRTRHFAPVIRAWDEPEAIAAIGEIVADADSSVDASSLWPGHPMDGMPDGNGSLYYGAAGVVWALDYLRRVQGRAGTRDLAPLLDAALERNAPWFASTSYPAHASLLMGELGILLVKMRVAPEPGLADRIYDRAASNSFLPVVELMWGLPGSMLACIHMHAIETHRRHKVRTVIQNQLHLPRRHRRPQRLRIAAKLRIRAILVAILHQRHARIRQRNAQPP